MVDWSDRLSIKLSAKGKLGKYASLHLRLGYLCRPLCQRGALGGNHAIVVATDVFVGIAQSGWIGSGRRPAWREKEVVKAYMMTAN